MNPLENSGLKRLIAFVITMLALLLNKRLGFELSPEEKAELVALTVAFIGQSAWKEVAMKKAEASGRVAAGEVDSIENAIIKLEARTKGPQP